MKFNLKNRPKIAGMLIFKKYDDWFEGFEAELREMLQDNDWAYWKKGELLIKEILGK